MVYHMIDKAVARDVYLPQISRALRRNGRLLITDHGPSDECVTTRAGAALGGMAVVPLLQEIREFTAAGLALVQTMDWPYMDKGFGLLWVDAPKATADLRQVDGTNGVTLNARDDADAGHTHGWLPAAGVRWLTVLVIAGCGCGALSALVSCAVLWTVLRRGRDAAGRPLRASGSAEWD